MVSWLQQQQLLPCLFQPGSHPEVMKRTDFLFRYLSEIQHLTPCHLSPVWTALLQHSSAQSSSHRDTAAVLYRLLQSVLYTFDLDCCDYLADCILQLPVQHIT